jgi:hypothetical protein
LLIRTGGLHAEVRPRLQDCEHSAEAVAAGRRFGATVDQPRKDRIDRPTGREFCQQATADVQIGSALARKPPLFLKFKSKREFRGNGFDARERQCTVLSARSRKYYAAQTAACSDWGPDGTPKFQ